MKKRFRDLDLTSVVYGHHLTDDEAGASEDTLSIEDLGERLVLTPEDEAVIGLMEIHRSTPARRALFRARTSIDPLDRAARSGLTRERALPCHFLPL